MSIKMEVWGDYACFTRPEMKVERVSYDVPTPSAARGMVESVYFHNGLRWIIDRIYVCNPIRFINIRRNEVASKVSKNKILSEANGKALSYINRRKETQQRATTMLRDVHYVIEAHFEMTDQANPSDNPGKFQDIVKAAAQWSGVHAALSWLSGMHGAFPPLGRRRHSHHRRNAGFGLYALRYGLF
jgi:CRISPR-associated protein Cas5d